MKYYATCPICGYRLFKAEEGTQVEIQCPKCKVEVIFNVTKTRFTIDKPYREKTAPVGSGQ